jgi:hypothetical protein
MSAKVGEVIKADEQLLTSTVMLNVPLILPSRVSTRTEIRYVPILVPNKVYHHNFTYPSDNDPLPLIKEGVPEIVKFHHPQFLLFVVVN